MSDIYNCKVEFRARMVVWYLAWALILWFSPVSSVGPCKMSKSWSKANCSYRGLTDIPNLHKAILILDFSGNSMPKIGNRTFASYQNLNELYLRKNSINKIEKNAFVGLSNLKVLNMSSNDLHSVPASTLEAVSQSLVQLVLSSNKITALRKSDFTTLTKLTHLDISGNFIKTVYSGAFANLDNLQVLKLHRNSLKSLPSEEFSAFPATQMTDVELGNNPWVCDCQMRWMWNWLNGTEMAYNSTRPVLCREPSINLDKMFMDLELDQLVCEIFMKKNPDLQSLEPGSNKSLDCKYEAMPEMPAHWVMKKRGVTTPLQENNKFKIRSYISKKKEMSLVHNSELTILNFKYEDIAEYECQVENILGMKVTSFPLTLVGVDFNAVTSNPPVGRVKDAGLDTRSVVIAVAVVSGVVLLVAIAVVITCGVSRMQRRKQMKQDAIVENVKQHFINNSEVVSMGDLDASKLSAKLIGKPPDEEDQVDGKQSDDHGSEHTNDSTATQLKRPIGSEETDPLYIFEQPGSPLANGNTYVSFGSELADPADDSYTTLPVRAQTLPHHSYGPRHPSHRGYESAHSHAGSNTPLLSDRYTPSVFDSDEPIEDYAQYPVYDSLTNSLHHPPHVTHYSHPSGGEPNSLHTSFQQPQNNPREHTYATVDSANSGFYSLANRSPSPAKPRNDSLSSYSSGERAAAPRPEPVRRLSSFQYPQPATPVIGGLHAPSSHTPGIARSTLALAPRYAPDSAYASDSADMYGYHQPRPGPADYRDYRDYRDMRYPTANSITPVPHGQIVPSKKTMSMSVGNLGYAPLVPGSSPIPNTAIGTVPRKPPRIYQSREYMELTPHDRGNYSNISSRDTTVNGGSYITSPEAQQYSQNYGITPGTPV